MRILIVTAATLLFAAAGVHADTLFFDDFNSYTPVATVDDSAAFEAVYSTPPAMSIDAGTGLGGSNALGNTGDSQVVRDTLPIDLASGTVTVSLYFRYEGAGGTSGPQIGLTVIPGGNVTGAGDISGRLSSNKLELRLNNGSALLDTNTQSLTTGNWYQLAFTAARSATPDQLNLGVALYNSDSDGNLGGMIDSLATTVTSAAIYADSSLYAIIRENTSITRMDNFAATQQTLPEPAAMAMFSIGAMLIAARRRR